MGNGFVANKILFIKVVINFQVLFHTSFVILFFVVLEDMFACKEDFIYTSIDNLLGYMYNSAWKISEQFE